MNDGIHNLSQVDYFAVRRVNASVVQIGWERTIAHMVHAMRYRSDEPTAAMRLGSAAHCAVLEPERFASEYVNVGDVNYATKDGKAARDAVLAAGKNPIKQDEYDAADAISAAVRSNRAAFNILNVPGVRESALLWTDADTGVKCKGRVDLFAPGLVLADLKTTANAGPEAFSDSIYRYGYHRQLAMYRDGYKAITGEDLEPAIIAVENDAPYCCAVYRLDDQAMELGRREYKWVLSQLVAAKTAGTLTSGYGDDIRTIGVPEWRVKRSMVSVSIDDGADLNNW